MSTWIRTNKAEGVFVYEFDPRSIEVMEVYERPALADDEPSCTCCGATGRETPCLSCRTAAGCEACQDPTCPCCHSTIECLDPADEEPEA